MQALRTDIPADHYEGCRPAAVDVKLANYVNNSIKELDIYRYVNCIYTIVTSLTWDFFRKHYDSTTWCFCFLDHRCNGGYRNQVPLGLAIVVSFLVFFVTAV